MRLLRFAHTFSQVVYFGQAGAGSAAGALENEGVFRDAAGLSANLSSADGRRGRKAYGTAAAAAASAGPPLAVDISVAPG